jgi:hypothetical protein
MRLLPNEKPRPRLLESAEAAQWPSTVEHPPGEKRTAFGKRLLRLVIRIAAAALILSGLGFWMTRRGAIQEETIAIRKLISVGTHMLSNAAHPALPPTPIVVQLNTDLVQVTSVALGHPRLAVINGKQVAEGDTFTVHIPTRSVAITLRVLEISDRQVKLTDGTQVMTAHLTKTGAK